MSYNDFIQAAVNFVENNISKIKMKGLYFDLNLFEFEFERKNLQHITIHIPGVRFEIISETSSNKDEIILILTNGLKDLEIAARMGYVYYFSLNMKLWELGNFVTSKEEAADMLPIDLISMHLKGWSLTESRGNRIIDESGIQETIKLLNYTYVIDRSRKISQAQLRSLVKRNLGWSLDSSDRSHLSKLRNKLRDCKKLVNELTLVLS